jgi:hypothetical protein
MIFDFNVHLVGDAAADTPDRLRDEGRLDVAGLGECYERHRAALRSSVQAVNLMLFNQALPFEDQPLPAWTARVRRDFPEAVFTQLLDFRRPGLGGALDRLAAAGVGGVKFHSYVQRIADADIPAALDAARAAAERGVFVCIDASYGTTRLYDYDNLKLAAAIVREVRTVPIVILHSGGARRWEAMLLAEDNPNVLLETSFTLPYYEGSAIAGDLAFIYRKIGVDRVLYASDFPYVGLDASIACMERFLEAHAFSAAERAAILGGNARRVFGRPALASPRSRS